MFLFPEDVIKNKIFFLGGGFLSTAKFVTMTGNSRNFSSLTKCHCVLTFNESHFINLNIHLFLENGINQESNEKVNSSFIICKYFFFI